MTDPEIYQDDWMQRLKEMPYDPLEDIRQEHKTFLAELEALAVQALADGDWSRVYARIAATAGTKTLSNCFDAKEGYFKGFTFIDLLLGESAPKV